MAIRKLLEPDKDKSIFKMRIVFKELSTDPLFFNNGQPTNKFKILYSRDFEDERHEEKRKNHFSKYNGYVRLKAFLDKIYNQNNLKSAALYANLTPDRPMLESWVVEDEVNEEEVKQNF